VFSRNPGILFDRDAILDKIKGHDEGDAFDRSIDVLLSRLRQKLGDDPKKPDYIKTIWGSGYKFIGRKK
jgi:DNA-binding response OmpR family regulator